MGTCLSIRVPTTERATYFQSMSEHLINVPDVWIYNVSIYGYSLFLLIFGFQYWILMLDVEWLNVDYNCRRRRLNDNVL